MRFPFQEKTNVNPIKAVDTFGQAKHVANIAARESNTDETAAGASVSVTAVATPPTLQHQSRAAREHQFGALPPAGHTLPESGIAAGAFKPATTYEIPAPKQSGTAIANWSEGEVSDAAIKEHFTTMANTLSNAWPRDWPRTAVNDPPEFLALASSFQNEKIALFEAAVSKTQEDVIGKLEVAIDCANTLHAKEGHNQNVIGVARIMLGDERIKVALVGDPGISAAVSGDSDQFDQAILEAARWHGLSDRDIPVAVLTAKRAPSADDKATFIELRSASSAKIYAELDLPNETAANLIRQTRVSGDASRNRPVAAQFLDVMDRISAMGAKPFFKTDGKADADKIFKAIDREMAKEDVHVALELRAAIKTCVEEGQLDAGLLACRKEDIYVRA